MLLHAKQSRWLPRKIDFPMPLFFYAMEGTDCFFRRKETGLRKEVGFFGADEEDEDLFITRVALEVEGDGSDPLLNALRNSEFSAAPSPRIEAAVLASSPPRRRACRSLLLVDRT